VIGAAAVVATLVLQRTTLTVLSDLTFVSPTYDVGVTCWR
jgi:hypothetical protein